MAFDDPTTISLIWVFTAMLLPLIPAMLLYKFLPSTADVSGPFRGLQIKLSGAFAAYFLLVIVIYFWPRPKPHELGYEVWTLSGRIQEEDGTTVPQDKINLNVQPRSVDYLNDGSFEMDVLVKRGQDGKVRFPTLSVERQPAQPFGNATVHLDPSSKLYGMQEYPLDINADAREITITEPIKLKKIQEQTYQPPAGPAPKPTVVAASPSPSTTP